MSKMMKRTDRKPPLPKSPIRSLGTRRVLRSALNTSQSSPGALIKTPLANRSPNIMKKMELRPEYQTISCEFQALAKMVQTEFGSKTSTENPYGSMSNPFFERGRLYDEYSARRNERLKRKREDFNEDKDDDNTVNEVSFRVESTKKADSKRRDVAKKKVVSTPMTENRSQNSRYMLRSLNKENKKPSLPLKYEGSAVDKSVTRRARKI